MCTTVHVEYKIHNSNKKITEVAHLGNSILSHGVTVQM